MVTQRPPMMKNLMLFLIFINAILFASLASLLVGAKYKSEIKSYYTSVMGVFKTAGEPPNKSDVLVRLVNLESKQVPFLTDNYAQFVSIIRNNEKKIYKDRRTSCYRFNFWQCGWSGKNTE